MIYVQSEKIQFDITFLVNVKQIWNKPADLRMFNFYETKLVQYLIYEMFTF